MYNNGLEFVSTSSFGRDNLNKCPTALGQGCDSLQYANCWYTMFREEYNSPSVDHNHDQNCGMMCTVEYLL
jgi:hypothetical protein